MKDKGPIKIIRTHRDRQGGQTIIVALIILGLLLILGFVFIGIVSRSIRSNTNVLQRNRANDIAEAGIRYAHRQLQQSEDGADWRGGTTLPVAEAGNPNLTRDPDAFYLRVPNQGAGLPQNLLFPNSNQVDLGGPDGLGPFVRIGFEGDRALVRVRYAPSDLNLFSQDPRGPLRNPGAVRSYLMIESVGRSGQVNPSDPTTLGNGTPIQFQNFANQAQFNQAIAQFSAAQAGARTSRMSRALVAIGLTDSARWFTNKFKVSRPADLGIPPTVASTYGGAAPSLQLGLDNLDSTNSGLATGSFGLGSFRSNADVTVHGNVRLLANRLYGDQFAVAGTIKPDDGGTINASVQSFTFNGAGNPVFATQNDILTGPQLDSRSPAFRTLRGIVRDGISAVDDDGFSRGLGREEPPSILTTDPDTKETRYLSMTRESGVMVGTGNSGQFGHGRSIYVDNVSDRQTARTEAGRQAPSARSLVQDWLDPNNRDTSGWNGPFYMPRGAYLTLQYDGFTITRDGRAPATEREWKFPDGTPSGQSSLRYRIGRGTDGVVRIVNALTDGIGNERIGTNLTAADYNRGLPFTGVLYFEGNVRVRGVIPTDVQMNVVSNGTIYIEGSITKGVTGNAVTATDPERPGVNVNARLNRLSRSMIALMAKDWVAVNTTMFFGPVPTAQPETVNDQPGLGLTPVRIRSNATDGLSLQTEFVLAPLGTSSANALNPVQWRPLVAQYEVAGSGALGSGTAMGTELLLTHAVADQATTQTFIAASVNGTRYQFLPTESNLLTDISPLGPGETFYNAYGMGQPWQIYPKFETATFPFLDPTLASQTNGDLTTEANANTTFGDYSLFNSATNTFNIRPEFLSGQAPSDYLLGKAAIVPHDVKIEALIYAEEGSFFVIPGQWFNPNPNDLRSRFEGRVSTLGGDANAQIIAEDERLRDFGNGPSTPFYGEPIDVKVTISGAVNENMPPSMAQQSEWLRKWGWIPGRRGTATTIPTQHLASDTVINNNPRWIAPNLVIAYDPVLASGRSFGFTGATPNNLNDPRSLVRRDSIGRALPPVPRLPVSPALAYFGDID